MNGIKFADSGIIEGWGAPYGDPTRRDQHGEFFTARTDFALDLIPSGRPLLIGHGLGEAGPAVVGRITSVERRPGGLWITAQLDRAGAHFQRIKDGLLKGILGFSSATMAHLAKVSPSGEILAWPLVEVSLTDSPASGDARIVSVRSAIAHFDEIGQPRSALKALVMGREPTPEELDYARAVAEVNRIEFRAAELEYRAIAAKMDARLWRRVGR